MKFAIDVIDMSDPFNLLYKISEAAQLYRLAFGTFDNLISYNFSAPLCASEPFRTFRTFSRSGSPHLRHNA